MFESNLFEINLFESNLLEIRFVACRRGAGASTVADVFAAREALRKGTG